MLFQEPHQSLTISLTYLVCQSARHSVSRSVCTSSVCLCMRCSVPSRWCRHWWRLLHVLCKPTSSSLLLIPPPLPQVMKRHPHSLVCIITSRFRQGNGFSIFPNYRNEVTVWMYIHLKSEEKEQEKVEKERKYGVRALTSHFIGNYLGMWFT